MKRCVVLCALVLWLCGVFRAQASMDIFLALDGVPGESIASGFADQIVIESFSTGLGNSGGGAPSFYDLSLSHALDKASPVLMLKCAQGATIATAVLTCRTLSGAKPVPFYVIRLTNVKVTSVAVAGSGGGDRPTENFTLSFESIEWEYTPFNSNGSTGQSIKTKWDLPKAP